MKITVDINRNIFGKNKNYIASFGAFTAKGNTKEEAKENLITALEWYFDYFDHDLIFKTIPEVGVTLILQRTFAGYSVMTTYHNGSQSVGFSDYGRIKHREALKHLESHAQGYAPVTV